MISTRLSNKAARHLIALQRLANNRLRAEVAFQFRDIRAKAATDTGDLAHSQKLLAHKNREMTEHYVKTRMGERVKPLR